MCGCNACCMDRGMYVRKAVLKEICKIPFHFNVRYKRSVELFGKLCSQTTHYLDVPCLMLYEASSVYSDQRAAYFLRFFHFYLEQESHFQDFLEATTTLSWELSC